MLNEEGLPFVGINFEEDEPYIPRRPPSPKPTLPSASTSTSSSTNEAPKVRVGGLIQRNGKQTLRKLSFSTYLNYFFLITFFTQSNQKLLLLQLQHLPQVHYLHLNLKL